MTDDRSQASPFPSGGHDPFLSLKYGATELYLIRHADALPGADEINGGDYDKQALSALGRRQAQALAAHMRQTRLAAVYSSPIGRARQTAGYVADALGQEVQIEPGLREVALGRIGLDVLEGMTPDEVSVALRARLRDIAVVALTTGSWSSFPSAEPSTSIRARMVEVVEAVAARHRGQRVALISHGGSINAYIAAILGIERDYFFPAANTSISLVRINGTRRLLLALNDIAHLRHAGLLDTAE